jgi:hypothetical protein|tara:strand:- start:519 stop:797 length:279 start_codon:yes stop_codon:yes gene_type:complete
MKNPSPLNLPSIKIHTEARVLIPDPAFIHKTIEITGIEYSAKRKPRRITMRIIKKWLEAIKKFFTNAYPEPIVTKPTARKTNVKRTTRKKSK